MKGTKKMQVKNRVNAAKAKVATLVAIGTVAAMSQPAMAAAIDVADVVSDIKGQIAAVVLIGGAVLLVYAAVKAFKWVRGAMS